MNARILCAGSFERWTSCIAIVLLGATIGTAPAVAQVICPGDRMLQTQTDVEVFGATGCTEVEGNLTIGPEDFIEFPEFDDREDPILDLSPLAGLAGVGGTLTIRHNSFLTDLTGLDELTTVGGDLHVGDNAALTSLNGLHSLVEIGGSLEVYSEGQTAAIASLSALGSLKSIGGDLHVWGNHRLETLEGLEGIDSIPGSVGIGKNWGLLGLEGINNLTTVGGGFGLWRNVALESVEALRSLSSIGGFLTIEGPSQITTIEPLRNLTHVGGPARVEQNPELTDCLCGLMWIIGAGVPLEVSDNGLGCSSVFEEILRYVSGPCDVTLTSQTDVDAFAYRKVFGNLTVTSSVPDDPVRNLTPLRILEGIDSDWFGLFIEDNPELTSLSGINPMWPPLTLIIRNAPKLESLDHAPGGFYVHIENVPLLETIELHVRSGISIRNNAGLRYLDLSVETVTGEIEIVDNPALLSISGLEYLSLVSTLTIEGNASLRSLPALPSLEEVGELSIVRNASIRSLAGLENLNSVRYRMHIHDNASLVECSCGLEGLISDGALTGVEGEVIIRNNAPAGTCNSPLMVLQTPCSPYDPCDDITTLPQWDGRIHSNGDGTGWLRFTAPTGMSRVHFYNTTNLSTDLSDVGFVSAGTDDWLWGGSPAGAPLDVVGRLETVDKSEGRIQFWVRLHDTCERTVDLDPMTDLGLPVPLPTAFALDQNYPNPFNPTTTIVYSVPDVSEVRIGIYDQLGREVTRLVYGVVEPGRHHVTWNADGQASGVYLLRMEAGTFVSVRQIVVVR